MLGSHVMIIQVGYPKERQILHYQFRTWTEQEIPDIEALLEFRRKVKLWTDSTNSKAPILVHCG